MRFVFCIALLLTASLAVALTFFLTAPALYAAEGVLAGLAACLIALWIMVVRPMSAMRRGIDLLKAQDFSSRLVHVGYLPADRIADTFNIMIAKLRTERLRVEEQNQFLKLLSDVSPMGIVIYNFDGTIYSANPSAARMLGHNPAGRRMDELSGELPQELSSLARHTTRTLQLSDGRRLRCAHLSFFDHGHERSFMLIESLTEELLQAERNAYGKVIRTMAHEVNNTLAGIIPIVETAAIVADDKGISDATSCCIERCGSLGKFINSYAEIARLTSPSLRSVDINSFVLKLLPFLESLVAKRRVGITVSLDQTMRPVDIDTVQMEQALVNIVKNSAESIGEDGSIEIVTSGQLKSLVVIDNGPGIRPEAAGQLFTPFFSTKSGGRGIGLTLTAEILRGHGFAFSLATSPSDSLTRFTIRF